MRRIVSGLAELALTPSSKPAKTIRRPTQRLERPFSGALLVAWRVTQRRLRRFGVLRRAVPRQLASVWASGGPNLVAEAGPRGSIFVFAPIGSAADNSRRT